MPRSQIKQTEAERVAKWKAQNPDKVRGQVRRKRQREQAARRAADPTGELNYGPIAGVDEPYPDSSEIPPAPKPKPPPPPPEPVGIQEPLEFKEELRREQKRAMLEQMRAELAHVQPRSIP